jgi:uncharacterized membrane protein YdjX (TVP38/TMEM64 family)
MLFSSSLYLSRKVVSHWEEKSRSAATTIANIANTKNKYNKHYDISLGLLPVFPYI